MTKQELPEELREVIAGSPIHLRPETFAMGFSKEPPASGDHYAVFRERDGWTIVTEEETARGLPLDACRFGYRLLEIDITTPFEAPGFLAAIARAVASRGLNILILSTYPRDNALLREADLAEGLDALRELGFRIVS